MRWPDTLRVAKVGAGLAVLLVLGLLAPSATADVRHLYDENGRLVETIGPNGESVHYQYDAAGNLLSINRVGTTTVSISGFTPAFGAIGAAVTIAGSGFSPTAAENVVRFNGVVAAVSAATATELNVTVPGEATNGPITVTTPTGSAISATSFYIGLPPPTISSFTPTAGAAGTSVVVSGQNFDTAANATTVKLNQSNVSITAISSTSLTATVPSNTGSGRIKVTTAYGTATSTEDFTVPPAGVNAADIVRQRIAVDGDPQSVSLNTTNKVSLLLFDAGAGQNLGLALSNLVVSSGSANVTIYRPDNQIAWIDASACVAANAGCAFNLGNVPVTGTYAVLVRPASGGTASFTATLSSDITGPIAPNTPYSLSTTRPGQNARLTFSGTAGQNLGITTSGTTFTGPGSTSTGGITLYKPDGSVLSNGSIPPGQTNTAYYPTLPSTGTYTLLVDPPLLATMSTTLMVAFDVPGTIVLDGTPTDTTISVTGQRARLTFDAVAGQNLGLALSNLTLSTSSATVNINQPNGQAWISGTNCAVVNTGCPFTLENLPATGTYTVVVVPANGGTGSFRATLSSDVTAVITPNVPYTFNTIRTGQNARLTFSGTAGQNLGITTSGTTFTGPGSTSPGGITLYKPDGSTLTSGSIPPGQTNTAYYPTLPSTGTYTLLVDPPLLATMSATLAVVFDVPGTIVLDGTPTDTTIGVTGQRARLTFDAVAGQNLGLALSNLALSTPFATVNINQPSGQGWVSVTCAVSNTGCAINLPGAPQTGTYTVVVIPASGGTGSFRATLSSDVTAGIVPNTPYAINTRTGQNARLTFNATAGQNFGITTSGTTFTGPGSDGTGGIAVFKPDGAGFTDSAFLSGQTSIAYFPALPTTGTYTLFVDPPLLATMSTTLIVAFDVPGRIGQNGGPVNTALDVTGQRARLTFKGKAGQNLNLAITNLALSTSSGSVRINQPDGQPWVNGATCAVANGGCSFNISNAPLTGTYTLIFTPLSGGTGSFTTTLTSNNSVPTANAGANQTVDSGAPVTLSGSGTDSDGAIESYLWAQTAGPAVTLAGANTATATFTAPQVTAETVLTFRLTVTDDLWATAAAEVSVTVRNANQPPVASAGADQAVNEGATVTLTGSATDSDGTIASYAWTQTAGPAATLTNAATAVASFTAPSVTADTVLTFRLTVTDNLGATGTADTNVTVRNVNQPPIANAGTDQSVNEGAPATLTGSGTDADGTIASYAWTQTAGPAVTLSGAATPTATFTAPQVTANTALTFRLTVTDNDGGTASAITNVTVNNVNQLPVANAGAAQAVNEGAAVTLTGSGTDADGTIASYAWTQTAGPVVTLTGANTATATFTAPQVTADTVLTFLLTVTDNNGGTGSASTNVTVRNVNAAPVANAGANQSVNEGVAVTLAGTGTDSDGTIASYAWSQTAGPVVTLSGATTATASFTAPQVTADTVLTFRLTVTDNQGATGTATTNVTVRNVNAAPVANAGANQSVNEGVAVTLTGSGTDSDGTIASYAWAQTAGPTVTLTNPSSATASFTAPQVTADTVLTFRLTVTDNQGATGSATANVTVRNVNQPPTANAGANKTVDEGSTVTLAGSGSDPDGTIAAYQWTQTAGPAVILSGAATATATFTAPQITANTNLTFRLTVTDNNGATASATTTVTVRAATARDLIVSALSTTATQVTRGQSITVANTVINQGATNVTGSFSVRLYLSTDSTITTADTVLGTRSISSLAAGASNSANTSVTIPTSVAVGTYYIGAIVDYNGTVTESNETNNSRATSATIRVQ